MQKIHMPGVFVKFLRIILSNYDGDNWKYRHGGNCKMAVIGMVPVPLLPPPSGIF